LENVRRRTHPYRTPAFAPAPTPAIRTPITCPLRPVPARNGEGVMNNGEKTLYTFSGALPEPLNQAQIHYVQVGQYREAGMCVYVRSC
jgi:hypothetical protein